MRSAPLRRWTPSWFVVTASPVLCSIWSPRFITDSSVIPQQDGGPWRWPTRRNPTVRQGGNVMTTLMLPTAFLLADRITVAGADGRQPSEKYFWRYNPQLQYSDDLMKTVFDSHPSFFRYVDYSDYYDEYCGSLEDLIQVGERAGKRVSAVTPSWIPALRHRGAAEPARSA